MILYNGASGGLGRYLAAALARRGLEGHELRARLEDRAGLRAELAALTERVDRHAVAPVSTSLDLNGGAPSVSSAPPIPLGLNGALSPRNAERPSGRSRGPTGEAVLLQLAARVSVPGCEADPQGALKTNVADTREAVLELVAWAEACSLKPRVLYVSSGHVYAARPPGERLDELAPLAPRSVYARSKLLAEEALQALATERGFELIIARVFGLIAPAQPANYVLPGMIRRVREEQLAGVPGLSCVRDYLDARDVCDDLLALCDAGPAVSEQPRPQTPHPGPLPRGRGSAFVQKQAAVVNVCSGEGVTLRHVLEEVVRALRPDDEARLMGQVVEAPARADDVASIVGDPSRFIALTGAQPRRTSLEETVRDACAAH